MTTDSSSLEEASVPADEASISPDEAFAVLGDETRIAILRALFENPHEPTSFSELRQAVGVRDSGQFNYHLNKLVGRFVRKTEDVSEPRSEARGASSRGGYALRLAGWQVVGSILSGTYTESGDAEPVPFDHECPECRGVVVATYEDERMEVVCADCDERFSAAGVPPGALEGFDREERPDRFDQYVRGMVDLARRGICATCSGRMDPEVVTERDPTLDVDTDDFPRVAYRCRRCPEVVTTSLGVALLDHPAVVSFHWERGVDLRSVPTWTLGWPTDGRAVVESVDPLRVRIAVELDESGEATDGDRLELVVDENANVVETATSA